MKVAVTYENGNVFPHFGYTQIADANGSGHGCAGERSCNDTGDTK